MCESFGYPSIGREKLNPVKDLIGWQLPSQRRELNRTFHGCIFFWTLTVKFPNDCINRKYESFSFYHHQPPWPDGGKVQPSGLIRPVNLQNL
jgi:hypothetical protein